MFIPSTDPFEVIFQDTDSPDFIYWELDKRARVLAMVMVALRLRVLLEKERDDAEFVTFMRPLANRCVREVGDMFERARTDEEYDAADDFLDRVTPELKLFDANVEALRLLRNDILRSRKLYVWIILGIALRVQRGYY